MAYYRHDDNVDYYIYITNGTECITPNANIAMKHRDNDTLIYGFRNNERIEMNFN